MAPLDARASRSREGGPSFPLRHRVERAVWGLAWGLLASWTPRPLHAWRRLVLVAFGAKVAATARVYPGVRVWYPRNLEIGDYAVIGPGAECYCMERMVIGRYAIVSQGAFLCGGTHDVDDPEFQLIARPVTIGPDAWVAADAFVGPGVTVGEGAVLGARGVAVKNLEPWGIYAGNPARLLRMRSRDASTTNRTT